jgi:hypothetical protein
MPDRFTASPTQAQLSRAVRLSTGSPMLNT